MLCDGEGASAELAEARIKAAAGRARPKFRSKAGGYPFILAGPTRRKASYLS
jgi:hypothetical protein